jgi:MFS superfamily sulfate permease-like transporter
MISNNKLNPFKHFKSDIPASIVVFLVAVPLCLAIAKASDVPLLSGLIAGIIGGIVVGSFSGSSLGVSGPAAGLVAIVAAAVPELGGFEFFLVAVIIAGILQIIMGMLKAGIIAYYFPSSVIHGMLAGIGVIIFFKQIPHAFGYDKDPEGDLDFIQSDNQNTLSELWNMTDYISYEIFAITLVALFILIFWDLKFMKKLAFTTIVPGPLVAVASTILMVALYKSNGIILEPDHMVSIPVSESTTDFFGNFTLPNFSALGNYATYKIALMIALVASIETLLCVEATDKLDPLKRITPTNKELRAQGIGNIISGFIGGLPITQVIVRSSANLQAGGKTKMAAILHGFFILVSIALIPAVLNLIPIATLAAILMLVGFKLAKPALFKKMYKEGWEQFLPFLVTVLGVFFTDLLLGITMGMVVAIFIILKNNFKVPLKLMVDKTNVRTKITLTLSEDVTFLNKASLLNTLNSIEDNRDVVIDASGTHFIHYDALEIIQDFKINAKSRDISVTLINIDVKDSDDPLDDIKLKEVIE